MTASFTKTARLLKTTVELTPTLIFRRSFRRSLVMRKRQRFDSDSARFVLIIVKSFVVGECTKLSPASRRSLIKSVVRAGLSAVERSYYWRRLVASERTSNAIRVAANRE